MSENKNQPPYIYFDLTTQERDSALRFLLNAIIKIRTDTVKTKQPKVYDEDVNVYLAHLLFAISLPEYHEMANPYLSGESTDIANWVNQAEDKTLKYFIYKVNADHLLIHSTIFNSVNENAKSRSAALKKSEKHFRELAVLYYQQASNCHQKMYRKKTGIGEVLIKVANNYEYYHEVLQALKEEYFYFVNTFRDCRFQGLLEELEDYENEATYDEKLDEFLLLYNEWMITHDEMIKHKIVNLAENLKSINPEFQFDSTKLDDAA